MADAEKKTVTEEFKVSGASLMEELKRLVHEGNVTHIIVRDEAGATVFETPLAFGILGLAILPLLAGIAAIVVLAAHYTIAVTRVAP